ncbi:MAG TPA: PepSY domain-containing protein [Pseudonocardia sp.]
MSEILDSGPRRATDPARSVATSPPAARSPRWWVELRPLLLRLHFYAGVFAGPFLLVAAVTGLLYTVTPQIEQIVHRHELTAGSDHAPGAAPLPLQAQVASAVASVPDGTVFEIRPASTPEGTTRVSFESPTDTDGYTRTAFVDPYNAQVRGVLRTYGEWLPVRAWFDELHRTLHLGTVGEVYSEVAASWLWVVALSGLGIWIGRRRRDLRLRRTLLPEGSARGRTRLRSWHASVGLWAAIGMLFLSATGLTWSQFAGANVTALRSTLDWKTPSVSKTLPSTAEPAAIGAGPAPADLGATADLVRASARVAGVSDPIAITPATTDATAWVVEQTQRSWPVKQDSAAVDPRSGVVVDHLRFADWPIAAKLARWGIDAHMGLLFGVANQVILAVLALGISCIVVWGYRMWWLRTPTGGTPVPLGAGQRPGFAPVLALGVVAVGVGLFLPVLGTTLVGFLVFDVLRQHRRPVAACGPAGTGDPVTAGDPAARSRGN